MIFSEPPRATAVSAVRLFTPSQLSDSPWEGVPG
jgi:hypothetical protein